MYIQRHNILKVKTIKMNTILSLWASYKSVMGWMCRPEVMVSLLTSVLDDVTAMQECLAPALITVGIRV